jgi:hypothetical protein
MPKKVAADRRVIKIQGSVEGQGDEWSGIAAMYTEIREAGSITQRPLGGRTRRWRMKGLILPDMVVT